MRVSGINGLFPMASFRHLLSPGSIGGLTLRNRIVMSAMGSDLADEDGVAGETIRAYYEARAQGGVGLIITEAVPVAFPSGFSRPHAMALRTGRQRAALQELIAAIHRHSACIALQLNHHGPMAKRDMVEGRPLLVPSQPLAATTDMGDLLLSDEAEFQRRQRAQMPPLRYHVMSQDDIAELVSAYAMNALRAREAGADALEIHAAHGFLLSAFLSPHTNRRDDDYGGSVENRARFLVEVIRQVKAAVGQDFPVWCKIDTTEFLTPDGTTLEDALTIARLAEKAGAAAIMASTSANPARAIALTESNIPDRREWMIPNAMRIRQAVSIPVIAAGRMEPEAADRHIAQGHFDFAAFGRKLLADADFARKLAEARPADIRPCIYCYACISQLSFDRPVKCAVNAQTGHERSRAISPARRPLGIAVVGAGPAGMEAARRLSLAGHGVSLFEAGEQLGGTLRFAALAYTPNQRLLDWLIHNVEGSKVEILRGHAVTVEQLRERRPDFVVVATGARRDAPAIKGADRPHVLTGDSLRALLSGAGEANARLPLISRALVGAGRRLGLTRNNATIRALSHLWMPLGRNVTIIGSELVGLELAEFLAHRKRRVTIVDDAQKAGAGMHVIRRARVLHELAATGVRVELGARDIRIEEDAVHFQNGEAAVQAVAADTVIIAKGARADRQFAHSVTAAGFAVSEIGDCKGVGYIEGAMADAADLVGQIERLNAS